MWSAGWCEEPDVVRFAIVPEEVEKERVEDLELFGVPDGYERFPGFIRYRIGRHRHVCPARESYDIDGQCPEFRVVLLPNEGDERLEPGGRADDLICGVAVAFTGEHAH